MLLTGYFGLEERADFLLLASASPPVGAGGEVWDSAGQQGPQWRTHAVHAATLVCRNRRNSQGMLWQSENTVSAHNFGILWAWENGCVTLYLGDVVFLRLLITENITNTSVADTYSSCGMSNQSSVFCLWPANHVLVFEHFTVKPDQKFKGASVSFSRPTSGITTKWWLNGLRSICPRRMALDRPSERTSSTWKGKTLWSTSAGMHTDSHKFCDLLIIYVYCHNLINAKKPRVTS